MSENIIYCYSGSGHCLNMAKSIARILGDTDIVMMRAFPAKTDATEAKRVGFVFPCYGGGLPGDVESYIKAIKIAPNAYKFAVEQYAGYIGCGLHKIDEIVDLDYWATISNHSTCIWLMPHVLTIPPTSKKTAQKRLDQTAEKVAAAVKAGEYSEKKPPKNSFFALGQEGDFDGYLEQPLLEASGYFFIVSQALAVFFRRGDDRCREGARGGMDAADVHGGVFMMVREGEVFDNLVCVTEIAA